MEAKEGTRMAWAAAVERAIVWSIVAACVAGGAVSMWVLLGGAALCYERAWPLPYARMAIELDALSAWFMLPLSIVGAAGAVYGQAYLPHKSRGKRLAAWWWYGWLLASMAIVFMARNAVLFLIAWEVMTVASFFLVTMDDENAEVRYAGCVYLVAGHAGTAILIALFVVLGTARGGEAFAAGGSVLPQAGALFVLAVAGFGVKAGLVPLHVWLPEAHPAAPSHVSALMSGVMIKTGVYGIMRMLMLLGEPAAWWGWSLIGIGVMTGVVGAMHAIVQRDMKRVLAYSSVDNVGIIMIGVGCGVLGRALEMPVMSACGFAGALLHVLHHGLFKGLLFMGAGAVVHRTGTRMLGELGGLARRMRWTGVLMCTGVLAMAAAPVLNGCVSEALVLMSGLYGMQAAGAHAAAGVVALGGLALTGGLAALCSVMLYGVAFLGEARSRAGEVAEEVGEEMRMPMVVLAGLCVMTGCGAPLTLMACEAALTAVTGALAPGVLRVPFGLLTGISSVALIGAGVGAVVYIVRRRLRRAAMSAVQPTWGCGYAQPTARMQYTGMSFVQPVVRVFGWMVSMREECALEEVAFPRAAEVRRQVDDVAVRRLYAPFSVMRKVLERVRMLQHGRVHLYLMYIVVTLLLILLWKAR